MDIIHPIPRQTDGAIEGPTRQTQDSESDKEEWCFLTRTLFQRLDSQCP